MTDLWLGWCAPNARQDLMRALHAVAPAAGLSFALDAGDLRGQLLSARPGSLGAIVGLTDSGVSDENLAAAIAHDGRAARVVLACREATGSLRSRMAQAGVTDIIEVPVARREPGRQAGPSGTPAFEDDWMRRAGSMPEPQNPPAISSRPSDQSRMGTAMGDSYEAYPDEARTAAGWGRESEQSQDDGLRNGEHGEDWRAAEGARRAAQEAVPAPAAAQIADEAQDSGLAADPVPSDPDASPILTFISGRGGVGKTTLAATASCIASQWGLNVALIDLDLSCGNLYSCFGLAHGSDLARLGASPTAEDLGRCCVQAADHVSLWGPCERPEMAERVMPQVADLISYAASRYDLALIDASTTFSDAVAQAVQMSDRVIVVNDERSGAIASAARASSLAVRLGVARTRIVRVANLCDPRAKGERIDRAQDSLEESRSYKVFDGDIDAEELIASGHVSELAQSDSPLVGSLQGFLAKTLQDLGALPDSDDARKAVEADGRKRRMGLFGRKKEAV